MGMDVVGTNPTSERGEYFRNNVWWWRPLWNYCVEVAPDLCEQVSGQYNDGDGLDAAGAAQLAHVLHTNIKSGATKNFEQRYNEHLASLPRRKCEWCEGTGVRTDKVGIDMGMPEKALEPEVAILTGRTHGWCNGCSGEGTCEHPEASYPFSAENVQEFADFLEDSGGFKIW